MNFNINKCTQLDHKEYINVNKDIIGYQVKFNNLQQNDSLCFIFKNISSGKKIIISIVDSGCTICIKNFNDWNTFFGQKDYEDTDIYIIFFGGNFNTVHHYYDSIINPKFKIFFMNDRLFIYDNNLFMYLNKFLLVNSDNRILAVGDPLQERHIDNIFRHLINS
ncbi:MAG: hypothetical protein JJU34_19180 [Lunatimonas sp.]|uniref:hypothetical protein n=1 Tax=Lunatimonas sp. TaxID=2060141 RepID=UPI00263AFBFF|nr:hypothetical protein [Lunatimonas sp.]MCC5939410.1 hypothetical protein [Lunatimonas sp.]